ncbi:DUF2953 domain-containing protein [Paenibacillus nanensis]|uniref:DUF2953 domain-containing protein n=1 Tax=Paenibacillus nanensis TaxID=393251 RepID=A0A3A1V1Z4_9BACL|nr:DUF2953 domain-containing protein [Paenibacillus nanensis]RIX53442.1 DUF2953 domain-containing protein [Paenibacillus nanensis]
MPGYPYGWIMAGGFFFLLVIALAIASPVVIKGYAKRVGENDVAELRVKALYGLIRFRYKIPIVKWKGLSLKVEEQVKATNAGIDTWEQFENEINKEKVERAIDKYKQILHLTRDLKGWAKDTLSRVELIQWNWTTSLGTGDAMWTAMATGAVWSIKTSILGLISQMVQLKSHPAMSVEPDYKHPSFTTEWSCIAQIRFGYAILAGLQLLARMKKWKGGIKTWQNILFRA